MADSALLLGVVACFGLAAFLLFLLLPSRVGQEPGPAPAPVAPSGPSGSSLQGALREVWHWVVPPAKVQPKKDPVTVPPLPGLPAQPPRAHAASLDAPQKEALRLLEPVIAVLESRASGSSAKKEALQSAEDLLQGLDNASRARLYWQLGNEVLRKVILKTTAFQPEDLGKMFEATEDHSLQSAVLERMSQTRGVPASLFFELLKRSKDPGTQERLYDFIASRDPAFFDEAILLEAFRCAKSPGMRVRCGLKILSRSQSVPVEALAQVLAESTGTDIAGPIFASIVARDPKFFPPESLAGFLKDPASPGLRALALQHLTEFHGKGLSECSPDQLAAMAENLAEDLSVRCLALAWLGRSKVAASVGVMGRIASESKELSLARSAALALGDLGTPEACKVLLDLFSSGEPSRRSAAAEGLSRTQSESALDLLTGILRSNEARAAGERLVRVAAAIERNRRAGGLPFRVKELLLDLLARNPAGVVGADAAEALGELKVAEALPLLLTGTESPDEAVRVKSVTALGRLGIKDDKVLKRLKAEWQEGPSFESRRAAEAALKELQKN